ncbi:DUF3710 domain-containing protein [Streptomyces avidinii]|uniref:DUF3710 domain-containing protein n=1 Tax=Streptomyces avidinii TaxID=1895 RepID=UPI0016725B23|nr:hypothetical protein GCM10010343_11450 [Streptomyces avidinii]
MSAGTGFAAPRTEGIWDPLRKEIITDITQSGGTADEFIGPFGREVFAQMPGTLPNERSLLCALCGSSVWTDHAGSWGPITGRDATMHGAADALEAVFRGTVVARGKKPMAPREECSVDWSVRRCGLRPATTSVDLPQRRLGVLAEGCSKGVGASGSRRRARS